MELVCIQIRALGIAELGSIQWINGLVSLLLLALAIALGVFAIRAWRSRHSGS